MTSMRDAILERLGPPPEPAPPDVDIGEWVDAGDHARALVRYAVEPSERVSAWLLRPAGAPPSHGWPALLAIHQHGGRFELGKSEPAGLSDDPQYHYGLDLCRRGYVVLCPDLLCFEDRRPPADVRAANPYQDGASYEFFEFSRRLLRGSCLQTKYLHDLRCGVDVLAALPEVDATRLGTVGHSLGGQEVVWLLWFDPRLKAGFASCGIAPLRTILDAGIAHNKAMYVPDLLSICDLDALVAEIAPRALILSSGEDDAIFPIAGVRELCDAARAAYGRAGAADAFEAAIFAGGHSLPDGIKARAYSFLDDHLAGGAG